MGKTIISVLGVVLTLVGIIGFIPALTPDGNLLGIFAVNSLHNVVHLLTGLAALYAVYMGGPTMVKLYAQVFGVVYALVSVLGLIAGNLLGLFPINGADNGLHLLLTIVLLYVGFFMSNTAVNKTTTNPVA